MKNLRMIPTLLAAFAVLLSAADAFAAPTVSNVTFVQQSDGAGDTEVVVNYDLLTPDGPVTITLLVSCDGGASFPIVAASVSGDVGPGITTGTLKTIAWAVGADLPGVDWPSAAVRVLAETEGRPPNFGASMAAGLSILQTMVDSIESLINNQPPSLDGNFTNLDLLVHATVPRPPAGFRYATHNGRTLAYVRNLSGNDFTWNLITDPTDTWYGYQIVRLAYELVIVVGEDGDDVALEESDSVALRKRVVIDYVPMHYYAILYDGDLEFHPGPVLNVRGCVHTNSDLRVSSIDKLYFHNRVTAAGHFYKGGGTEQGEFQSGNVYFKDGSSATGNFRSFKTTDGRFVDCTWDDWATRALDLWKGNLRDWAHGTRKITPPLPEGWEALDMIQRRSAFDTPEVRDVKFEYHADLIITGDPGDPTSIEACDAAGSDVATTYTDAGGTTRSYISVGEFYDGQQKTVVRTLDIDMGRLKEFLALNPDVSFTNGVIYASTTPLPGDTWSVPTTWAAPGRDDYMAGVRVENAAELPRGTRGGFSFATDRPLYTTGNINTVNQAAAVFAADAVTVCSFDLTLRYSYVDPNTGRTVVVMGNTSEETTLTLPIARESTTNAVFMMGNVPTLFKTPPSPDNPCPAVTRKSGGVNNVMRYLENWSGKRHRFNGSIIVMFASRLATGPWDTTSYYFPPRREYDWDTSLKTAIPPVGTPLFFAITKGDSEIISRDYAIDNLP